MAQSILDIFKQSSDANIGQTMIRLAKLAQARHRYEHAFEQVSSRKDESPTHGSTRAAVARHTTSLDAQVDAQAHTEVDQ